MSLVLLSSTLASTVETVFASRQERVIAAEIVTTTTASLQSATHRDGGGGGGVREKVSQRRVFFKIPTLLVLSVPLNINNNTGDKGERLSGAEGGSSGSLAGGSASGEGGGEGIGGKSSKKYLLNSAKAGGAMLHALDIKSETQLKFRHSFPLTRLVGMTHEGAGGTSQEKKRDEEPSHHHPASTTGNRSSSGDGGGVDLTFDCGGSGLISVEFESNVQREMMAAAIQRMRPRGVLPSSGLQQLQGVGNVPVEAFDPAGQVGGMGEPTSRRGVFSAEEEARLLQYIGERGSFDDTDGFQQMLLHGQKSMELELLQSLVESSSLWAAAKDHVRSLVKDVEVVEQRIALHSFNLLAKRMVIQKIEHDHNTLQRRKKNLRELHETVSRLKDLLQLETEWVESIDALRKTEESALPAFFENKTHIKNLSAAMRHMEKVIQDGRLQLEFPIAAVRERKEFFLEQRRLTVFRSKSFLFDLMEKCEKKYLRDRKRQSNGPRLVWRRHNELHDTLREMGVIVTATGRIDMEGFIRLLRKYRVSMRHVYAVELGSFFQVMRPQLMTHYRFHNQSSPAFSRPSHGFRIGEAWSSATRCDRFRSVTLFVGDALPAEGALPLPCEAEKRFFDPATVAPPPDAGVRERSNPEAGEGRERGEEKHRRTWSDPCRTSAPPRGGGGGGGTAVRVLPPPPEDARLLLNIPVSGPLWGEHELGRGGGGDGDVSCPLAVQKGALWNLFSDPHKLFTEPIRGVKGRGLGQALGSCCCASTSGGGGGGGSGPLRRCPRGGWWRPDIAFGVALQCVLEAVMMEEEVLVTCFGISEVRHSGSSYGFSSGGAGIHKFPSSSSSSSHSREESAATVLLLQECLIEIFGGDSTFSLMEQLPAIGARVLSVGTAVKRQTQGLGPLNRKKDAVGGESMNNNNNSSKYELEDEEEEETGGGRRNGNRNKGVYDEGDDDAADNDETFWATFYLKMQRLLRRNFLFSSMSDLARYITHHCDKTFAIPILCMIQALIHPTHDNNNNGNSLKGGGGGSGGSPMGLAGGGETQTSPPPPAAAATTASDQRTGESPPPGASAGSSTHSYHWRPSQSTFCSALLRELETIFSGTMIQHLEEQCHSITKGTREFLIHPRPLLPCFSNLPLYVYRMEALLHTLHPEVCDATQYKSILTRLVDQLFSALDEVTGVAAKTVVSGKAAFGSGDGGEKGAARSLTGWDRVRRGAHRFLELGARAQPDSLSYRYTQQYRHHVFFCTFYQALSPHSHAAAGLKSYYDMSAAKRDEYEALYLTEVLLLVDIPVFGAFTVAAEELLQVYSPEELRHHRSLSVDRVTAVVAKMEREVTRGIERSAERIKQHFLHDVAPDSPALSFHKTLLQRTWNHYCLLVDKKLEFMDNLLSWEAFRGVQPTMSREKGMTLMRKTVK